MKKNIILAILLSITFSANAKEGHINPYWFGGSIDKSANPNDNLDSIDSFLNGVVDSTVGALNDFHDQPVAKATKNGWHLAGFQTGLGVGFSGNIGVVAFGGTKVLEIDWAKKKAPKKEVEKSVNEEELESSIPTVTINETHTKAELNQALEPVIRQLVDTGRVKDELEFRKNLSSVSNDFYAYTKGLQTTRSTYLWRAGKIRLDLNFAGSGKLANPTTAFIKFGVDVRLRLDFIRINPNPASIEKAIDNNNDLTKVQKKIARGTKTLLDKLSYEVTKSYDEMENKYDMKSHDFVFGAAEVALGFSVQGSVGVATLKGTVVPAVFFTRHEIGKVPARNDKSMDNGTINLIVDNDEADFSVAKSAGTKYEKGIKETIFKLQRKRVRKGLKKAIKFGYKFSRKMHRKAVKRQKRMAKGRRVKMPKWIVKKIRSQYKFAIGGTVGPAKMTALPHMSLFWVNKLN